MSSDHLKIEYMEPSRLRRYERNARLHSEEQVTQLVQSIREFGFTNPVLLDANDEVIAGHGRLAAAEELGLETVPVIRLGSLSPSQVKALRISDNQLALNSTWDLDLLAAEVDSLSSEEFDLDLLGFDEGFIAELLDDPDMDFTDGYSGESTTQHEGLLADVKVAVGPYWVQVQRSVWDTWETSLRAEVGFDRATIEKTLLRRLGFK